MTTTTTTISAKSFDKALKSAMTSSATMQAKWQSLTIFALNEYKTNQSNPVYINKIYAGLAPGHRRQWASYIHSMSNAVLNVKESKFARKKGESDSYVSEEVTKISWYQVEYIDAKGNVAGTKKAAAVPTVDSIVKYVSTKTSAGKLSPAEVLAALVKSSGLSLDDIKAAM
jgi:hypothetical protein